MQYKKTIEHNRSGYDAFPASMLNENLDELKMTVHRMAYELLKPCTYCLLISTETGTDKPVSCSKFTGLHKPRWVSLETCFSCGEFRK